MVVPVPIHSFSLNGNVDDSHGSSDGTVNGTEMYSTGRYGSNQSFLFDGNTGITLANESNLDFEHTDPFSIEFVIFIPSGFSSVDTIFAKTNDSVGTTDAGYGIIITTQPRIIMRLNDETTRVSKLTTILDTNSWHHITCTYNGNSTSSGIKMYHEGLDVTGNDLSGTLTSTMLNNESPHIGHESDGDRDLETGIRLQAMNIYNVELDAGQAWNAYTNHLLLQGNAELDLLNGKVATRKTIMGRTFSWTDNPSGTNHIDGQIIIDTALNGIYRNSNGSIESVLLSSEENIAEIIALT